jgi:hypothetical protein
MRTPDFRTALHELAHSWCSYVTFNDTASGVLGSRELLMVEDVTDNGRYHWGEAFDDGRSCMDYDRIEWVANGNGTFTRKKVADLDFNYCSLDLYLMGLLPASQVGPLRILRDRRLLDAANNVYAATVKTIGVENIIANLGARAPATSGTNFRQALVVVSNDPDAGLAYAERLENDFRRQYEAQFARATGGRATLNTTTI